MKLVINFGHKGIQKEVDWYQDIMAFPKLIRFQSARWEWATYDAIDNGYELTFSQIPSYDPNFYVDMPSFEDMFEWGSSNKCCCGAIYTSFNWDHMFFCPKWVKW